MKSRICTPLLFATAALGQLKISVDLVQIDAIITDSHANLIGI